MSIQNIIQEARALSVEERKELMKALVDLLAEPSQISSKPKRSIRKFRGLGAHLYDGTDAQAYLNKIRDEWDERS